MVGDDVGRIDDADALCVVFPTVEQSLDLRLRTAEENRNVVHGPERFQRAVYYASRRIVAAVNIHRNTDHK